MKAWKRILCIFMAVIAALAVAGISVGIIVEWSDVDL